VGDALAVPDGEAGGLTETDTERDGPTEIDEPSSTVFWVNGNLGLIHGNTHTKHTATTATMRTRTWRALTQTGPGSRRHNAAYID